MGLCGGLHGEHIDTTFQAYWSNLYEMLTPDTLLPGDRWLQHSDLLLPNTRQGSLR
jgi:hypothetical protein